MSLSLLDQLKSSITPQLAGYSAKTLGETPAHTERAIDAALPAILSGVASASRMPSGLTGLARLVGDPINDGTLLTQLPALYQGTMTAAPIYRLGSQLLHAVFGNKLGQMSQSVAALSGIKPASSALLVSMLAPHVISVLGKRQRSEAITTQAGLARLLETEAASINKALPPALGQIFGVPGVAAAAANAAAGVLSAGSVIAAGIATPARAAPASGHAAANAGAAGQARIGMTRTTGATGPWIIFPIGLFLGVGLIGLGAILGERHDTPSPASVAAATPAMPPAPAAKAAGAKAAPPPVAAETAPVRPAETKSAAAGKHTDAKPASASPPGTTTFFGKSPAIEEMPARLNPDYKPQVATAAIVDPPAAPAALEVPAAPPPPAPGNTTYFGSAGPSVEIAAIANPDYKPSPAPAAAMPASPPAPPVAGATTYFGTGSGIPETPAKPNPDYRPSPSVAAVPQAKATATVPPPAEIVPKAQGLTTYFGKTAVRPDAPARANPDYRPAPAAAAAPETAAKSIEAPKPSSSLDITACQAAVTSAVRSGPVLFQTAEAKLTRASVETLDRVAAAFKGCKDAILRVEGHTDNAGSADMNLALSEQRARSVTDFLVSRGIDAGRINPAGFGLTRPAVPNSSPANKALNRRIEFIVAGR